MNLLDRGALRRIILGAACGAATLLAVAAPAGAGAPTRIDAEYWGVSCVAALGGGQTLFLFGSGTTDGAEGGIGAFVEAADGSLVAEGQATDFAFGSTFHAVVGLGSASFAVEADVTRGPSTTEVVEERDGNSWTKGTASHADVTFTGTTASYDGRALELGEGACSGEINGFDVRSTNPSATISSSRDFGSEICDVDGLTDGQVRLSGVLPQVYAEVVLDHGGEDVEKAQGEILVRGGRGALTTDLVDLFTGETRTRAQIDLRLERSGRTAREVVTDGRAVERRSVTPYTASVSVTTADGRHGTARCAAVAVSTQLRIAPGA